jgi:hypothetical protein
VISPVLGLKGQWHKSTGPQKIRLAGLDHTYGPEDGRAPVHAFTVWLDLAALGAERGRVFFFEQNGAANFIEGPTIAVQKLLDRKPVRVAAMFRHLVVGPFESAEALLRLHLR